MVDRVEQSGFWLPPEFLDDLLTEELIVADKSKKNPFDAELCFPREFQYENKGGEKSWVMSTSPQSTLTRLGSFSGHASGNGSPDGVYSPPATPFTHTVEDLINRAAGQVERLKLNGADRSALIYPKPHIGQPRELQLQQKVDAERYAAAWYGRRHQQAGEDIKIKDHVPWSGPTRIPSTGLVGGPNRGGGKKACAGTGVFLPRRYDNDDRVFNNSVYPPDSRRKTGHSSDLAYIRSVHMANMMNHYNVSIESHPRPSNYEMLMARRNALMLEQQKQRSTMLMEDSSLISRGIYLPREWTY